MRTFSKDGHKMMTDILTRDDGSPRNRHYFALISGGHSWWWSLLLKMVGVNKGGRKYEVLQPFEIVAMVNGNWVGVKVSPGYRFDGPTGWELDDFSWWNPFDWVAKWLGMVDPWQRSWWLPMAALHDRPYKDPEIPRNLKAVMVVNDEELVPPDRRRRILWDQAFRNGLIAAGASPNAVGLAYQTIRDHGQDMWDQYKQ